MVQICTNGCLGFPPRHHPEFHVNLSNICESNLFQTKCSKFIVLGNTCFTCSENNIMKNIKKKQNIFEERCKKVYLYKVSRNSPRNRIKQIFFPSRLNQVYTGNNFSLEYNFSKYSKSLTLSACKFLTLTLFIYLKTVHQILCQPLCNISSQLPWIPVGNFHRNTIQYGLLYDPPTGSPHFH